MAYFLQLLTIFAIKTQLEEMKYLFGAIILVGCIAFFSCGNKQENGDTSAIDESVKMPGDSTIYGLACDGCNDSTLVFLPNEGGDPVKYNIVRATRDHKIYGSLEIGDWVGVVLNPKNKKEAIMVIDLDQLKGTWTYQVMPHIKESKTKTKAQIEAELTDSMKAILFIPREYGFTLLRHQQARAVGNVFTGNTLQDESVVEYPPVTRFTGWRIFNGRLVMTGDTVDLKRRKIPANMVKHDTLSFVYMLKDSLVLDLHKNGSKERIIFHRQANAATANRRAQEAADKQAQKDSIR